MLAELSVSDLGVIDEVTLLFDSGMTALTGETGAGKTMLVGAIGLLAGDRADPSVVRPGAEETTVQGRFVLDDDELVLTRVVPRSGRSRAYRDGHLITAADLTELANGLVDLHAQHGHVGLLTTASQRRALDRFAGVDLRELESARAALREAERMLEVLGGDASRATPRARVPPVPARRDRRRGAHRRGRGRSAPRRGVDPRRRRCPPCRSSRRRRVPQHRRRRTRSGRRRARGARWPSAVRADHRSAPLRRSGGRRRRR